mmetsp:Transcript_104031/g.282634  ORF Transcript_104031/g.282634 Transcript_104031/m.282634 type:complete len:208 (+) Transcript_104031:213-836(+)
MHPPGDTSVALVAHVRAVLLGQDADGALGHGRRGSARAPREEGLHQDPDEAAAAQRRRPQGGAPDGAGPPQAPETHRAASVGPGRQGRGGGGRGAGQGAQEAEGQADPRAVQGAPRQRAGADRGAQLREHAREVRARPAVSEEKDLLVVVHAGRYRGGRARCDQEGDPAHQSPDGAARELPVLLARRGGWRDFHAVCDYDVGLLLRP